MDETKPPRSSEPPDQKTSKDGAVKHVVRTGLPPGVNIEDWKDPGKASPKGPADNRS